jgi:hypothetical protein
MLLIVEPSGEARLKLPAERQKRFAPRTPRFGFSSTRSRTAHIKKAAFLPALVDTPSFAEKPAAHGYACGVIALFLQLVQIGVSLRASSRVLELMIRFFELPFSAPDWTTGRMWLLRFGLAQLITAKVQADDWVWLIDHSVQIGK